MAAPFGVFALVMSAVLLPVPNGLADVMLWLGRYSAVALLVAFSRRLGAEIHPLPHGRLRWDRDGETDSDGGAHRHRHRHRRVRLHLPHPIHGISEARTANGSNRHHGSGDGNDRPPTSHPDAPRPALTAHPIADQRLRLVTPPCGSPIFSSSASGLHSPAARSANVGIQSIESTHGRKGHQQTACGIAKSAPASRISGG